MPSPLTPAFSSLAKAGSKLGLILAAACCLAPALAHGGASRPDPLTEEAGCDHYRGQPVGANDSTQRFELMLCTTREGVHAKVQTSSLVSGWSVRESVGSWDASGQTVTLSDTRFVDSRPEPGWTFCLIDSIVLKRREGGLSGTYVSEPCDDRATLELTKLEPVAADAGRGREREDPLTSSESPSPRPPAPPKQTHAPAPESGCACMTSSGRGHGLGGLALIFGLGLIAGARRTRRQH